jgi:hypothetical protein
MKQEKKRININDLKTYLNNQYEKYWEKFTEK